VRLDGGMDSKELIKRYLDIELADALEEQDICKFIHKETCGKFSDSQVKILASILKEQHHNISTRRVQHNVNTLKLFSVVEEKDESLKPSKSTDNELIDFVSKLEKMNDSLEESLTEREIKHDDIMFELMENIKKLEEFKGRSLVLDDESLEGITMLINEYNNTLLDKI